jgi:hypothetical protein
VDVVVVAAAADDADAAKGDRMIDSKAPVGLASVRIPRHIVVVLVVAAAFAIQAHLPTLAAATDQDHAKPEHAKQQQAKQEHFASADTAAQALAAAIKANDTKTILAILGAGGKPLIDSGDPVADRDVHDRFMQMFDEAHTLAMSGDAKAVLEIGKEEWPFPIPIVKEAAGWRFDTEAGDEEIINRRIGRNELAAIQAVLAYVDAQREYYARNPERTALLHYAMKISSTQGKRDGLYWDPAPGEPESPLGPLFAAARSQGYKPGQGKPIPFHGYYYRILTAQGQNATGGAYDYVAQGKLLGGFAMVAYPAVWDSSGVMTFVVNQDGVVFQKDLGPKTGEIARAMKEFNPDSTWTKVENAGVGQQ